MKRVLLTLATAGLLVATTTAQEASACTAVDDVDALLAKEPALLATGEVARLQDAFRALRAELREARAELLRLRGETLVATTPSSLEPEPQVAASEHEFCPLASLSVFAGKEIGCTEHAAPPEDVAAGEPPSAHAIASVAPVEESPTLPETCTLSKLAALAGLSELEAQRPATPVLVSRVIEAELAVTEPVATEQGESSSAVPAVLFPIEPLPALEPLVLEPVPNAAPAAAAEPCARSVERRDQLSRELASLVQRRAARAGHTPLAASAAHHARLHAVVPAATSPAVHERASRAELLRQALRAVRPRPAPACAGAGAAPAAKAVPAAASAPVTKSCGASAEVEDAACDGALSDAPACSAVEVVLGSDEPATCAIAVPALAATCATTTVESTVATTVATTLPTDLTGTRLELVVVRARLGKARRDLARVEAELGATRSTLTAAGLGVPASSAEAVCSLGADRAAAAVETRATELVVLLTSEDGAACCAQEPDASAVPASASGAFELVLERRSTEPTGGATCAAEPTACQASDLAPAPSPKLRAAQGELAVANRQLDQLQARLTAARAELDSLRAHLPGSAHD